MSYKHYGFSILVAKLFRVSVLEIVNEIVQISTQNIANLVSKDNKVNTIFSVSSVKHKSSNRVSTRFAPSTKLLLIFRYF